MMYDVSSFPFNSFSSRSTTQYAKWFGSDQHPGILDIAADLTLFVLSQCSTSFPNTVLSRKIHRESDVVPYSHAAKTLRYLLIHNPKYFLSNRAIAGLGGTYIQTQTQHTLHIYTPTMMFFHINQRLLNIIVPWILISRHYYLFLS